MIRLRLSDGGISRTDLNNLPAPPPHIPQNWGGNMVGNRLLLPPSSTPNSSRKSPVLNNGLSVPRSSGGGAFPTGPPNAFSADNSIYGIVAPTGAPPPSWRLTEDTMTSIRHMGDI